MNATLTGSLPLSGSLVSRLLAHALVPTLADAHAAHMRHHAANINGRDNHNNYAETPHRATMRALLDAAAVAGCTVTLSYFKEDRTRRVMLCKPLPSVDGTRKYATVLDEVLTEENETPTYRRVCLDTITGIQMYYRAGDAA